MTIQPHRRIHPRPQDLLARYISAFETYDMDKLVELFTAEAVWEMPPFDGWYQGPRDIVHALQDALPRREGRRHALPDHHRQWPAGRGALLLNADTGRHEDFQLHVLDIRRAGVAHVVAFMEPALFAKFGLPDAL